MATTSTLYSFTNCGKNGAIGPNQTEANNCYKTSNVKVSIVGQGIQKWIVPFTGQYKIEAAGAAGLSSCTSNIGGNGTFYSSLFVLHKNDFLYILVGQQGILPSYRWGGSGGGATYVVKKEKTSNYYFSLDSSYVKPLLIAAGGGGSGDCNHAGTPKEGESGKCETSEEGGGATGQAHSSGGAGFISNSANTETKSFINGGVSSLYIAGSVYSYGGFGGGGNANDAGGGGGGYKGGDSGNDAARGCGGYSFNRGIKVSCISSSNSGVGYARVIFIKRISTVALYPESGIKLLRLISMLVLVSR